MKLESPTMLISRSAAWQGMGKELETVVGMFLNAKVSLVAGDVSAAALRYSRGGLLINVRDLVQIGLIMGIDEKSAGRIASHMFGEDSPDLGGDVLGELVNVANGTLRAAFGRESYSFVNGLPTSVAPASVFQLGAACRRQEVFWLAMEGARILVRIYIIAKPKETVPVAALMEGMFLTKDLFNQQGAPLIKEGTLLSLTNIERLHQFLDPNRTLDVVMATFA